MSGLLYRVILGAILAGLLLASTVSSAEQATSALSPRLYRAFDEATALVEEGRTAEAIGKFEALRGSTREGSYDRAVVDRQIAFLMLEQGRSEEATAYFRRALDNRALPSSDRPELLYVQVQLLAEAKALPEARRLADQLLAAAPAQPKYHGVSAYVAYLQEDYERALREVDAAIAGSPEPRESWLQIAMNVHITREDWEAARRFVYPLIERSPGDKTYWMHLVQLELRRNDTDAALRAMVLAHQQGLLTPAQFRTLAQLWAQSGAPDKGARLLQAWMDEGQLPADAGLFELRGNFWLMARETARAIDDLQQAAGLDGSGRLHLLVGEIAFRDRRWQQATESLAAALRSGSLKNPERVQLLLGIAAVHAGNTPVAREALTPLTASPASREQARYWLGRL